MKILSAEFVKSATGPDGYPEEGLPEVAIAGRSNVGKSSLINVLVQRKKLARTSSSPGHTRLLNFFRVNGCYSLVDLPGYGWAKVSQAEREKWRRMVEGYLGLRQELRAVVIIQDLRRPAGQEEKDLIAYLTHQGIPPVLVVTKADKLSKSRRDQPRREIAAGLGLPPENLVLFSAVTGEGREELWEKLVELMGEDNCG